MDLETLTTPVRYIYVGLERSRGLFFPANLQREVGPAKDAFGGTRWRTRKRKTGASRTKRTKRIRGEGTGRKRRSIWSHMTMYDEGMMDEGAASLRDRDMIAGKRGGPSVHVRSVFSFFRTRLARPRVFRPSCASNATHARTNAPLSLVWPILLSYSTNATV